MVKISSFFQHHLYYFFLFNKHTQRTKRASTFINYFFFSNVCTQAHPEGAPRPRERPAHQLQRWPRRLRPLQVDRNHHRPRGLAVRRRPLLPIHPLPPRLPFQAPQDQLHDPRVPPEHQQERRHLPGHPEGPVEPRPHHLPRPPVNFLSPH